MKQMKITNRITARESLALDKYLNEIGKLGLLNSDEEVELTKKIKQGDQVALNTMIKSNLRFVVSVAKQYQNQGLPLTDLINEGNLGLIKACTRFDETKGFKFISYAVWWIRQSILHSIIEHSRIVRVPLNKVGNYNKVNEAYSSFLQENQRLPTEQEVAELLDMKVNDVRIMLKSNTRHLSMETPMGSATSELRMLEVVSMKTSDKNELISELLNNSLNQELRNTINQLNVREVEVLSLYFGLNGNSPHTLVEIGKTLNLTRERVRQIKEKSLRKMRKSNNSNVLRSYLG